jgi:hypothetical protein
VVIYGMYKDKIGLKETAERKKKIKKFKKGCP